MFDRDTPRIMIWKYEAAPAQWRAFYDGLDVPEWLAVIPSSLHSPDLEQAIMDCQKGAEVAFYETTLGDRVLVGTCELRPVFEVIAQHSPS